VHHPQTKITTATSVRFTPESGNETAKILLYLSKRTFSWRMQARRL
jgi:hypothetical protein